MILDSTDWMDLLGLRRHNATSVMIAISKVSALYVVKRISFWQQYADAKLSNPMAVTAQLSENCLLAGTWKQEFVDLICI